MIDGSGRILIWSNLCEAGSRSYPVVMIYLSVESWPAKNRNPRIMGRTMPEQPQNDEIRDLKCPTFSPTHPLVTRLKRSRSAIRPAAKGFDPKPQPLIHASRSLLSPHSFFYIQTLSRNSIVQ